MRLPYTILMDDFLYGGADPDGGVIKYTTYPLKCNVTPASSGAEGYYSESVLGFIFRVPNEDKYNITTSHANFKGLFSAVLQGRAYAVANEGWKYREDQGINPPPLSITNKVTTRDLNLAYFGFFNNTEGFNPFGQEVMGARSTRGIAGAYPNLGVEIRQIRYRPERVIIEARLREFSLNI